jgi:hypothetical protein
VARRWRVWGKLVQRNEFSTQPLCGREPRSLYPLRRPSPTTVQRPHLLIASPLRPPGGGARGD